MRSILEINNRIKELEVDKNNLDSRILNVINTYIEKPQNFTSEIIFLYKEKEILKSKIDALQWILAEK
jgi:hypothetical protein